MSVAEVKQAALADDVPRFVDALVALDCVDVCWGRQLDAVREAVKLEELPWRIPAAVALSERYSSATGEDARHLLDYVIDYLLIDVSRRESVPDALAILGIAAEYWEYTSYVEMERLGATVLKAGGTLAPEVVAVMRRTAAIPGNRPLKEFVAGLKEPLLNPGEPWADQASSDLSMLDESWRELVAHAATGTSDAPTPEWEEEGLRLLARIGPDSAREVILGWLALIDRPRTLALRNRMGSDIAYRGDAYNSRVLRGLVWLLGLLPSDAQLAGHLADLAEISLRKVPGIGPRNRPAAEGAIYALSRLDSMEAVAQLVRLAARATHRTARQDIDAAIEAKAVALQATREQLLDFAVPSFGLTDVGQRVQHFGDDTGILRIDGARVGIEWRNGTGTTLGSPPTAVKEGFPEQLEQFRAAAKELRKSLTALTSALERQLAGRQSWHYGAWRALVLDHVVVGTVARRLLWRVDGRLCGYAEGVLHHLDETAAPVAGVTASMTSGAAETAISAPTADGALARVGDAGQVRLWDPATSAPDEVLAAREWLAHHGIVQPFPQTG